MTEQLKKILIIEDDVAIRESLQELLGIEGYRTCEAANGRIALEILSKKDRVDLILLDLMMPEMDGQEFLLKREQMGLHSNCPVVVISAASYANPDPVRIKHFLRKPLDVDRLLALIRRLI